jgi:tetratricopeptide (TPR) repeat protein
MARLPNRFGISRYEADEYYQLGLDAYKKGRFDVAINNLNDAIALMPNRAELYATRGFVYMEDGVKDKAQADFQQAIKLYPLEMLAHYGRGMIAYNDRNWDEAIAHFTDAYKADPKRPETLYYLALAYHHKGDNQEAARRVMETALAAFPETDKRKSDAQKWLREFSKLLDKKAAPTLKLPANQPKLLP